MTRVLITGVRGKTGAPLAASLAAQPGIDVLGGSSDPSAVAADGVRAVRFSWDEPDGWGAAADGVDAIYLVRPDRADAPERTAAFLAEVPRDVRIVLLSEWDTDAFAPDDFSPRVEAAARASGHPWTMLRPSWFMQVFSDPRFFRDEIEAHGRLPFAGNGASVAWIDARDIAAVAERALLDAGHAGQVYELSGPESLTLPETAAVLAQALGRPVAHEEQSIDDAVAGAEGFERDQFVWTLERLGRGGFAGVTDTVERVTGRPARRLADFYAASPAPPA